MAAFEESCEEDFSEDSQQVTRTFLIDPWSARGAFLDSIMGGVRIAGDIVFRQLPARDPVYRWLYAKSCKFKPLDEDPGYMPASFNPVWNRALYTTGKATVLFQSMDNDGQQDPAETEDPEKPQTSEQQELDLGSTDWDFSARALKLPNQWFLWSDKKDGPNKELLANTDTGVTKVYPGLQVVATRYMCARKPFKAIIANLGRINTKPFWLQSDEYPAETLRFDSAKVSRKYTTKGFKFFDIIYTFACQPIYDTLVDQLTGNHVPGFVGWNRLFDPKVERWRYVRSNVKEQHIYLEDEADKAYSQPIGGKEVKGFKLLFDPRAI